jgi:hypothetical protein
MSDDFCRVYIAFIDNVLQNVGAWRTLGEYLLIKIPSHILVTWTCMMMMLAHVTWADNTGTIFNKCNKKVCK